MHRETHADYRPLRSPQPRIRSTCLYSSRSSLCSASARQVTTVFAAGCSSGRGTLRIHQQVERLRLGTAPTGLPQGTTSMQSLPIRNAYTPPVNILMSNERQWIPFNVDLSHIASTISLRHSSTFLLHPCSDSLHVTLERQLFPCNVSHAATQARLHAPSDTIFTDQGSGFPHLLICSNNAIRSVVKGVMKAIIS
jgi:hypothetical protein